MNDQDNVATQLAVNTGNMIASLNMQIANLQITNQMQKETIEELKRQNKNLMAQKEKGGAKIEPLRN